MSERVARLEQAVKSLDPIDHQVFLARRPDGMSYAAIAERTRLSPAQVDRSMRRALCSIGRHLRRVPPAALALAVLTHRPGVRPACHSPHSLARIASHARHA